MKRPALLLGFSFLISKILGLWRDNLLASKFGAGSLTSSILNLDTYYAAFRLPDLLFNLLSFGVLSAAFVPLLTEILHKEGKSAAVEFTYGIMRTIGAAILVISGVLFLFTPILLKWFVPGFSPENFSTTVVITRIMLITPFFFTIGSIAGGVQNTQGKFWGLALAPIAYNLGIVLGIVFLSQRFGVYGVALGVTAGAFFNMLVQIPGMVRAGFGWVWPKTWWTPRTKEMVTLALPRIFGMSVTQLSLMVDTIIASMLPIGSVTIINFASNLESLPIGLIGVSVAVASFGVLSTLYSQNNVAGFQKRLSDDLHRILGLIIPLAFGMAALRFPFVAWLLGHGKFDEHQTALTADTLLYFLIGLSFGGVVFLLARAFYSLKDTKTPVLVGIAAVIVNLSASIILTKFFSLATLGLALANSLADIINASLLVILLQKKLRAKVIDFMEVGKFLLAAIIMVFVISATHSSSWPLTFQIFLPTLVGSASYIGVCWIFRSRTLMNVL